MKARQENGKISVHAIAGTHAIQIGMDVQEGARAGLLGFAIRRTDLSGVDSEKPQWLKGTRSFQEIAEPHATDGKTPAQENIIQAFLWGDYTVKPNTKYRYEVTPLYGTPTKLEPGEKVGIEIVTENPDNGTHAVYFNRGVAGSLAYSRQFGKKYRKWYKFEKNGKEEWREFVRPQDIPDRKAYKWLSRGLEEAMLAFIAQATGPEYSLRAAVYEFTYLPVIQAFVDALERGVDVKIIHHAKQDSLKRLKLNADAQVSVTYTNTETPSVTHKRCDVAAESLPDSVCAAATEAVRQIGVSKQEFCAAYDAMMIERKATTISHNKFIVLLKDGKPIQVWTGSTNFTASGIFGQSNVGHLVRDEGVAAKYYAYWQKLQNDPPRKAPSGSPAGTSILEWTVQQQADLTEPPPPNSITPVFSPRKSPAMLAWYAERMEAAENSVFFTAAFTVADELFAKVMQQKAVPEGQPYLRYLLLESNAGMMRKKYDQMKTVSQNRIAWGDLLQNQQIAKAAQDANAEKDANAEPNAKAGQKEPYIETLTGLNKNVEFLHTKYMLVDPLSDDPIVITGSANFSTPSTTANDENMLIIRGDTCVADIFLTEFMRLFNHFRPRNELNARRKTATDAADADRFLRSDDSWTQPYFTPGTQQWSERLLFR